MKLVLTLVAAVVICMFASIIGRQPITQAAADRLGEEPVGFAAACGCNDVGDLTNRLKGVEAVLSELTDQAQGPAADGTFDASTFDSGLGESITRTLATSGGIGTMLIADIDRFSCEIQTGADLSNIPGAPAGLAGSACQRDGANAQLNIRRQACLSGRNSSNEGNDYWEGRRMSDVIRELSDAYGAEAAYLRGQLTGLARSCRSAAPKPPKVTCQNCVHYVFEGKQTIPVVGTIRMWADEIIPFRLARDRTISGQGTIDTILDMSGSPCKVSGYNGVADILVSGNVSGGNLIVRIDPLGASQRVSAPIQITCPPGGKAHLIPQQQNYSITEQLIIPKAGQQFTEKRIDLGIRTRGAMHGEIILRLFMKPVR